MEVLGPGERAEALLVTRLVSLWLFLTLFCLGCGTEEADSGQPSVRDTTPDWGAEPEARFLQADVYVPAPWELSAVSVSYGRHSWPGSDKAHQGIAAQVEGVPGRFRFAVPGAEGYDPRDTVFYQWLLTCRQAEGEGYEDVTVLETPVQRFVVGCSKEVEDRKLEEDQRVVLAQFDIEDPHQGLPGYLPVPTHGFASVLGAGIAFANSTRLSREEAPVLGRPDLLFYAPRAREVDESPESYLDAITDLWPDPPYRLVGWAYGAVFDPENRPRLGCIASDYWFIHEAGYHLPDGDMLLTPPVESVRGSQVVKRPNPPRALGVWHPRMWDLHIWRSADGDVPAVSILPPFHVPGMLLPSGTFFMSEMFE